MSSRGPGGPGCFAPNAVFFMYADGALVLINLIAAIGVMTMDPTSDPSTDSGDRGTVDSIVTVASVGLLVMIYLNFNTAFIGPDDTLVTDIGEIRKKYLKTWLTFDVCCLLSGLVEDGIWMSEERPSMERIWMFVVLVQVLQFFRVLAYAYKHLQARRALGTQTSPRVQEPDVEVPVGAGPVQVGAVQLQGAVVIGTVVSGTVKDPSEQAAVDHVPVQGPWQGGVVQGNVVQGNAGPISGGVVQSSGPIFR